MWNSLADYYIRSGLFERARDVYEESIQTVTTVRDFTQVCVCVCLRVDGVKGEGVWNVLCVKKVIIFVNVLFWRFLKS